MACIIVAWAVSYGVNEGMGGIVPFHFGLSVIHFWLIPAALTVIAWRYHLLGGVVMLLYSPIPFFTTGLITVMSEGHQDVSHLILAAFVLPVGAILHLAVARKEGRSKRASAQNLLSAPTCVSRGLHRRRRHRRGPCVRGRPRNGARRDSRRRPRGRASSRARRETTPRAWPTTRRGWASRRSS